MAEADLAHIPATGPLVVVSNHPFGVVEGLVLARLITAIRPDVLVKGADWAHNAIVGRESVEAHGGVVIRVPVEQGHSTTGLIERIREGG